MISGFSVVYCKFVFFSTAPNDMPSAVAEREGGVAVGEGGVAVGEEMKKRHTRGYLGTFEKFRKSTTSFVISTASVV